jgi:hypothetical protein
VTAPPPSLTTEQRGFLLALAALGAEKPGFDRALGGEVLRGAWLALAAVGRDRRATALAEWTAEVAVPLAPRIAALDPSWALEALADEPVGLALALAEGAPELVAALAERTSAPEAPWPLEPRARTELQKLIFGSLEALTVEATGPLGARLGDLDLGELLVELARWGARTVGTSLAGAPLELRARAMATAGAPWSSEIAAAAARPTTPPIRDHARALVAQASAQRTPTPLHRLRAVGLLALAPALSAEGTASALRVAGRLPVELGRALLAAC